MPVNLTNLYSEPQKYTPKLVLSQSKPTTGSATPSAIERRSEKDYFQKTDKEPKQGLTGKRKGLIAVSLSLIGVITLLIVTRGKRGEKTLEKTGENAVKVVKKTTKKEMDKLCEEALIDNKSFIQNSNSNPISNIENNICKREIVIKDTNGKILIDSNGMPVKINATITSEKWKDGNFYKMYTDKADDRIGSMITKSNAKEHVRMKFKKGIEPYVDDALYIDILESNCNKQYKGVGTELVKQAVLESKAVGHNGKIVLESALGDESSLAATPFYYKLGFKFTDPKKNAILENLINTGETKNLPDLVQSGLMYLPEENIERLLGK